MGMLEEDGEVGADKSCSTRYAYMLEVHPGPRCSRLKPRAHTLKNLTDDIFQCISVRPVWIVLLEFAHITNIPDVIPDPIIIGKGIVHFIAHNRLGHAYGLCHRAIAVATPPRVVHFRNTWILIEMPEHVYEVVGMDIIPDLLALVAIDVIVVARDGTFDQIGKKAV